MKIFNLIAIKSPDKICRSCACFQNDPATIENAFPGLTAMGSGFSSVRSEDGFCSLHQRYLSAHDGCSRFTEIGSSGNNF